MANLAVEVLQEVEDSDVQNMLGFPLVTKAEPYLAAPYQRLVGGSEGQTPFLVAALVVSALVIVLVVLALLFLLHRYAM